MKPNTKHYSLLEDALTSHISSDIVTEIGRFRSFRESGIDFFSFSAKTFAIVIQNVGLVRVRAFTFICSLSNELWIRICFCCLLLCTRTKKCRVYLIYKRRLTSTHVHFGFSSFKINNYRIICRYISTYLMNTFS